MKNEYSKGGMKVTDVESLDRSLKLKQFIRAYKSNHIISKIQALLTARLGQGNQIQQEYQDVTKEEAICQLNTKHQTALFEVYERQTRYIKKKFLIRSLHILTFQLQF
jgi:hypothetical protein